MATISLLVSLGTSVCASTGNPDTDPLIDNHGRIQFWLSHSLVSQETADRVNSTCDLGNVIIGPEDQVCHSTALSSVDGEGRLVSHGRQT